MEKRIKKVIEVEKKIGGEKEERRNGIENVRIRRRK